MGVTELRLIVLALAALALALPVCAEQSDGERVLREAFKGFGVVGLAQAGTGTPVTEVRRDADGTNQRTMLVVYLDAEYAAEDVRASSLADELEGRPFNAADVYFHANGNVIWRTRFMPGLSSSEAHLYFVATPEGAPAMTTIEGRSRIPMFVDEASAEAYRENVAPSFAESGLATSLVVRSAPMEPLIERMMKGEDIGIHVYSSATVERWGKQWDGGARLIKFYMTDQSRAFENLIDGSTQ